MMPGPTFLEGLQKPLGASRPLGFPCLTIAPAGVSGEGSPIATDLPSLLPGGVPSSYPGASLLGAGVRLEVEIDALGETLAAESFAKLLTGNPGS